MRFLPIQRVPRFFRRLACLALAACAVLGGAATARAQSVVLNFYMGLGSEYDITGGLTDYTDIGFSAGDIVQVVAVNSSFPVAGRYGGQLVGDPIYNLAHALGQDADAYQKIEGTSSTEPATYFESTFGGTGEPYDPYTVGTGQKIVKTTTLENLGGYLGSSIYINYTSLAAQGYDGIYIRVFSTNAFEQGVMTNSYWGVSAIYDFQYATGTEEAYFGGLQIIGENLFEVIPEPGTAALFGTGAAVAWLGRRRRKKKMQGNA